MGKNTNRRYKTHVFSDVFREEKQAWRPFLPHSPALPREGGEKPQMYKYRGTVVKSMHLGARQIYNNYSTT